MSRFTPLLRKQKNAGWVDPWLEIDAMADLVNLPRQWIVCPLCGEFGWRFPPHGIGEPCPIVAAMAEAQGLKADAERMMAVRTGVHVEEMGKTMQKWLRDQGLIDDEETPDE